MYRKISTVIISHLKHLQIISAIICIIINDQTCHTILSPRWNRRPFMKQNFYNSDSTCCMYSNTRRTCECSHKNHSARKTIKSIISVVSPFPRDTVYRIEVQDHGRFIPAGSLFPYTHHSDLARLFFYVLLPLEA